MLGETEEKVVALEELLREDALRNADASVGHLADVARLTGELEEVRFLLPRLQDQL